MKGNYQTGEFDPPCARQGSRCFVDGVEIRQVWFFDTDLGIVKTYDALGDGRIRSRWQGPETLPADVEVAPNSALSKTLRGKVELG